MTAPDPPAPVPERTYAASGRAALDVARLRAETPGCFHAVHLNNAGSALQPAPVTERVIRHLRLEERAGGYEAAEAVAEEREAVYGAVARLIGARPHQIAITDSATRAWNIALGALVTAGMLGPGDRVLTASSEYAGNAIALLALAAQRGVVVQPVPDGPDGVLDVAALAGMLDERVKLVVLTHVPSYNGLVNPAAAVGRVTRAAGIPFLLDACQSAGQLDLDVAALGCDLLTATGRKFLRGPRGTGFLYVADWLLERLEPALPDMRGATWVAPGRYTLRADARRFELFEGSVAAQLGLGTAVRYALDCGLPAIEERIRALAAGLRGSLAIIPAVSVLDRGPHPAGIVTFRVDGVPAAAVQAALRRDGVNVWTASPSAALWDARAGGEDVVRAGVHAYNTEDDLEVLRCRVERLAVPGEVG